MEGELDAIRRVPHYAFTCAAQLPWLPGDREKVNSCVWKTARLTCGQMSDIAVPQSVSVGRIFLRKPNAALITISLLKLGVIKTVRVSRFLWKGSSIRGKWLQTSHKMGEQNGRKYIISRVPKKESAKVKHVLMAAMCMISSSYMRCLNLNPAILLDCS